MKGWTPEIKNSLSPFPNGYTCYVQKLDTLIEPAELYLSGKLFVDRPESYSATHSKNCTFISIDFGKPFLSHHNYALSLSESCPRV